MGPNVVAGMRRCSSEEQGASDRKRGDEIDRIVETAIGARSEDGSYDDTTAALDKVAELLQLRLDEPEEGLQH